MSKVVYIYALCEPGQPPKETLAKMSKSRKEWWRRRESGASGN